MTEEKFKVIQFTREFILVVDKELDNFPRKELEIKSRLKNTCFDLLELLYETNMIEDVEEKKKLLGTSIAKVKIIDFLINLSFDKKLISNKQYVRLGVKLEEIIRYITGWLKKYLDNKK